MIDILSKFLIQHRKTNKPLLLALSGGPDSLALFHLLLEVSKEHSIPFAIAHVDHGWRPESGTEAEILKELAQKHDLGFHLKKLDPKSLEGNLEDACRSERLQFFKELCQAHEYEAVLMGHHADDAAETVLKRLFEGSSLKAVAGLQEVSCYDDLQIWRPLLKKTKIDPYFKDLDEGEMVRKFIFRPFAFIAFSSSVLFPFSVESAPWNQRKNRLSSKLTPTHSQKKGMA